MDFKRLKELARRLGGILVLDGNEPEFVVLPYEKYEKLESEKEGQLPIHNQSEEKSLEKLNQEILALKEEIRQKESLELLNSDDEDPIKPEAGPVDIMMENEQEEEPIAEVIDFE